ncbi:MAG: hypothetical protein AABW79_03525 [Nanoarchaeota archaeon]
MIILFGSTGDLAKKKLCPALYSLHKKGLIDEEIVFVGRRDIDIEEYIELSGLSSFANDGGLMDFVKKAHYIKADIDKPNGEFKKLIEKISFSDKVIYLATADNLFLKIISFLDKEKVLDKKTRVAFEKPFGHDLKSAKELDKKLGDYLEEEQIFRVDHYLGKDFVDEILNFRVSGKFEEKWNGNFIDNFQITISEDMGIEGRGEYYDKAGAIKDIVQSHMLQLLSLVAMERPKSDDLKSIRGSKFELLQRLEKVKKENCIVGQYEGYTEDDEVTKGSKTETFIAVKIFVDNPRWEEIPFYLKTGKKLDKKHTSVNVLMKDKSIVSFSAKGKDEAYQKIFSDLISGNKIRFVGNDEVDESWRFTDLLINVAKKSKLCIYEIGSRGPREADVLLKKDGRVWIN